MKSNETNDNITANSAHTRESEYENKKQLAARLGVSVRTIDNLMLRGLPYVALTGKLRRFPRATVDQWLADREVRRA